MDLVIITTGNLDRHDLTGARGTAREVSVGQPPTGFLHLIVGFDGSSPATRALDAAVRLTQGRDGRVEVTYVAHLSSLAMLSADAIGEIESDFDQMRPVLAAREHAAANPRMR